MRSVRTCSFAIVSGILLSGCALFGSGKKSGSSSISQQALQKFAITFTQVPMKSCPAKPGTWKGIMLGMNDWEDSCILEITSISNETRNISGRLLLIDRDEARMAYRQGKDIDSLMVVKGIAVTLVGKQEDKSLSLSCDTMISPHKERFIVSVNGIFFNESVVVSKDEIPELYFAGSIGMHVGDEEGVAGVLMLRERKY